MNKWLVRLKLCYDKRWLDDKTRVFNDYDNALVYINNYVRVYSNKLNNVIIDISVIDVKN